MKRTWPTELDDDTDESERSRRRAATRPGKPAKRSYESSPDVQRWVRREAEQHDDGAPEFNPAFLASRRDSFWVLSSLSVFYQQGLITDVIGQASSGKEATVYCCVAHPSTGADLLAAKVYRPRMFRSLSNDAIYRDNRLAHDYQGQVSHDARVRRALASNTERARNLRVESWIRYEYETQQLLYAAGAAVPRPLAQIGNAILMEYVGDQTGPAPRLKDVVLPREEAASLFDGLLANVQLWLGQHRVHGDLSDYNILVYDGQLTTIDFAQAVDTRYSPEVYTLLERDIDRISRCFARYGVQADPTRLASELWTAYSLGELSISPNTTHE